MNERGALNLTTVLAVVFGLGLAASVYLNIAQHQSAEQDKKLLKGEISDLRYQVKVDQQAKVASADTSPTPSPLATPEATPSPAATPTPAVQGASAQTAVQKNCTDAAFRAGADANARLISRLPKGTSVTVGTEVKNKYTAVTYGGQSGYLLTACLG